MAFAGKVGGGVDTIILSYLVFGADILTTIYGTYYGTGWKILLVLSSHQLVSVFSGSCDIALMMTGHGKRLMTITALTIILGIAGAGIIQRGLMLAAIRSRCCVSGHASPIHALRSIVSLAKYVRQ